MAPASTRGRARGVVGSVVHSSDFPVPAHRRSLVHPRCEGAVMRRYLPPLIAAAVLTATFQSVSPAAAHPTAAPAGVDGASVRTWNEIAVASIVATTPPVPGPVGPLY